MAGVRICLYKRSIAMAPTGIAASHIGGYTLHSVLDIPGEHQHSERPLKPFNDLKLQMARKLFNNVVLVVIDEMSMLSPAFLAQIDARLRIVSKHDVPFGGYKVLLMGDFYQLPPVCCSTTLYEAASRKTDVSNRTRKKRRQHPHECCNE